MITITIMITTTTIITIMIIINNHNKQTHYQISRSSNSSQYYMRTGKQALPRDGLILHLITKRQKIILIPREVVTIVGVRIICSVSWTALGLRETKILNSNKNYKITKTFNKPIKNSPSPPYSYKSMTSSIHQQQIINHYHHNNHH